MSHERISGTDQKRECAGSMAHLLASAERELSAFITAVNGLFDAEQARRAAEDWIEELPGANEPSEAPVIYWRRVTIAAATRLADRANGLHARI